MRRRRPLLAVALLSLATLAGLLASCSDDDTAAPDDTAPTSAVPTDDAGTKSPAEPDANCAPVRPAESGPRRFTFDGSERSYVLSVPDDYDGHTATPLLFGFHGWSGSQQNFEHNTSLGERGAEAGFLVVVGDALGDPREWNMFGVPGKADDYGYIDALIEDLEAHLCVDAGRVLAAGHSNGSAFTGFIACRKPYRFAAVALVSATVPSGCPDGIRPSILAIAGDSDPQVPYDGGSVGGGAQGIPPATDTIAGYRNAYGCAGAPEVTEATAGVRRETSSDCDGGARVVFDTVVGGTHPWPGGPSAEADPNNSEAGRSFDATGAILDFFEHA